MLIECKNALKALGKNLMDGRRVWRSETRTGVGVWCVFHVNHVTASCLVLCVLDGVKLKGMRRAVVLDMVLG